MAMTHSQAREFYAEQVDEALKWAKYHTTKRLGRSAVFNLSDAFNSSFYLALLEWRHGLAEPQQRLRDVVDLVLLTIELEPLMEEQVEMERRQHPELTHRSAPLWRRINIGAAMLASMLLDDVPDEQLVAYGPPPHAPEDYTHIGTIFDTALAETLQQGDTPAGWNDVLAYATNKRRLRLTSRCYDTYARIARAAAREQWQDVASLVDQSFKLLRQRPKDDFLEGGAEHYSGDGGEETVDFRLALILKHYAVFDQLPDVAPPYYRWRWEPAASGEWVARLKETIQHVKTSDPPVSWREKLRRLLGRD